MTSIRTSPGRASCTDRSVRGRHNTERAPSGQLLWAGVLERTQVRILPGAPLSWSCVGGAERGDIRPNRESA
jgi:hypothetical protein